MEPHLRKLYERIYLIQECMNNYAGLETCYAVNEATEHVVFEVAGYERRVDFTTLLSADKDVISDTFRALVTLPFEAKLSDALNHFHLHV